MSVVYMNMIPVTVTSGNTFPLPAGFIFASIKPATGASFTYTNSFRDGITSAAIDIPFTFPDAGQRSWAAHTITAIGGSIEISYATGN